MNIHYEVNKNISTADFIDILKSSGLSERRPINDFDCLEGMVKNSNLLVTAWQNKQIVGVARSVTDFNYACYLSDLAVSKHLQGVGIGKKLISHTQEQLGKICKIILLAAPNANSYYDHIGLSNHSGCWILDRKTKICS